MSTDAIVIGAGHNGLAAALRLAKEGRRVLVLERRDRPGGLCAAEEFHPGYVVPGLLHDTGSVRAGLISSLGLERHGLCFRDDDIPVFAPSLNGAGLLLHRDPEKSRPQISTFSESEAESYLQWRAFLRRIEAFIRGLLNQAPPPLMTLSRGDVWDLVRRAWRLRRLGKRDMLEVMRILPMPVADWLGEHFQMPILSELLAAPSLFGSFLGPRAAGTAANLIFHECTADRSLRGGPSALIEALLAASRECGVEVRTSAEVSRILVSGDRVTGVRLQSGDEIGTGIVVASCDPKSTFLRLIHPSHLALKVEDQFRAFRSRGTAAKVHLALSGPLEFQCRPGVQFEAVWIGRGAVSELDRVFDDAKYGRFSNIPFLDLRVPSLSSPGLAPGGHHVVSILAGAAPYELEGGWTPQRREALGDAVVEALARYAPSLRQLIVAREVLTPLDLEQRYGMTGGHVCHGEHALDQLLSLRPAPCAGGYATPVAGLFLGGSGSHPGGGVTCAPGLLAAEAVIRKEATWDGRTQETG
ncbi:MAG: phytoene desaturase family protein [Acidobacteriota bacterium]